MLRQRAVFMLMLTMLVLCVCHPALSAMDDSSPLNEGESAQLLAAEVQEMKDLIYSQGLQIKQLREMVEQQQRDLHNLLSAIPSGAAAADMKQAGSKDANNIQPGTGAALEDQSQAKARADMAASRKLLETVSRQLGNISLSGDVRVRYEPFFQEGAADRHRERFRARLHVTGRLSDEFSGGISLATGTLDDPVSTNQTMTGFFNRKNFGLDRAYVTYKPKYAKFLKLDAGKFQFPWFRTPMTFDNDLNPEGFAQTLSFDLSSALQNVTLVGFQLPFNEVSSGPDSFVLGGQIQTHYRIGPRVRLSLYGAGINIDRADPIAVAFGTSLLKPSLPNSNTLRLNSNGAVVGYADKFAYLDAILRLDINTHPRFPATILFDFVNNVRGSRERSGYWAEASLGRATEAGDMQLGYTFIRIEKDAVVGAWNESDLRSSTNVLNHRLAFSYIFRRNVAGQFTAYIGRLANPLDNVNLVPPGVRDQCTGSDVFGCEDPYQKRLQFDLVYKF